MAEIIMYGLTTCPHCKRAHKLLSKIGADFDVVWIDQLGGEERKKAIERVHSISGSYSVPLIVRGDRYVLGFNREKILELVQG
ncbi:glutaredoxin family protein [Archaeoglobus sp.]